MTRARKPQGLKKVFVIASRYTAREYALIEDYSKERATTPAELVELATTQFIQRLVSEDEAREKKGASEQP
jgi:hypothetical protein